jgi:hypothetical protein
VPRRALRPAPGSVLSPGELVRAWESAVRTYGRVQARAECAPVLDVGAAREMAVVSGEIARVWRELLSAGLVPQWVSLAVLTAADVFEEQADAWRAREARAWQAQQQGEDR